MDQFPQKNEIFLSYKELREAEMNRIVNV